MAQKALAIGFVLLIAGLAYLVSFFSPVFDPLVVGILIGIFLSNLLEESPLIEHSHYGIKIFLPLGIALYGFQLKFKGQLDTFEIYGLLIVFSGLFLLTYLISKISRINHRISVLLAAGMSVCGASAIAVISPAVEAERKETSVAVLSVMTAGLFWTILLPVLPSIFQLSFDEYGFLAGSALPMLGLVKVSASYAGQNALEIALKLKYIRIASLYFMVTVAVFIGIRKKRLSIPLFMWAFIAFATITNTITIPASMMKILSELSKFFLTATLSAIGLNTSFEAITEEGLKPFLVTFISLSVVIILILLMMV